MKVRNCKNGTYFTKQGMSSIIEENGVIIPVTVLKRLENVILGEKNSKKLCVFSGYYGRFNQPEKKSMEKYNKEIPNKGFIKEVDITTDASSLDINIFKAGDYVDVSAMSKGHGFQGGMKRYGFKGGRASHGNSLAHRSIGSTGCRHLPSKTIKGRKMAGHMGHDLRTQQNLLVKRLELTHDCLLVKGSVPGPKHGLVFVRKAVRHAI